MHSTKITTDLKIELVDYSVSEDGKHSNCIAA